MSRRAFDAHGNPISQWGDPSGAVTRKPKYLTDLEVRLILEKRAAGVPDGAIGLMVGRRPGDLDRLLALSVSVEAEDAPPPWRPTDEKTLRYRRERNEYFRRQRVWRPGQ